MNKFYFSLAICCLLYSVVSAQNRSLSGVVSDAKNGVTLIGVSILVKGTNQGTSTDANGKFSIAVPGNKAVLVINYVGYVKQEVEAGTQAQ